MGGIQRKWHFSAKRETRGDRILGPGLSVTDGDRRYAGSVQHRHARAGWRPLRNEVPFGGGLRPPSPHSNDDHHDDDDDDDDDDVDDDGW